MTYANGWTLDEGDWVKLARGNLRSAAIFNGGPIGAPIPHPDQAALFAADGIRGVQSALEWMGQLEGVNTDSPWNPTTGHEVDPADRFIRKMRPGTTAGRLTLETEAWTYTINAGATNLADTVILADAKYAGLPQSGLMFADGPNYIYTSNSGQKCFIPGMVPLKVRRMSPGVIGTDYSTQTVGEIEVDAYGAVQDSTGRWVSSGQIVNLTGSTKRDMGSTQSATVWHNNIFKFGTTQREHIRLYLFAVDQWMRAGMMGQVRFGKHYSYFFARYGKANALPVRWAEIGQVVPFLSLPHWNQRRTSFSITAEEDDDPYGPRNLQTYGERGYLEHVLYEVVPEFRRQLGDMPLLLTIGAVSKMGGAAWAQGLRADLREMLRNLRNWALQIHCYLAGGGVDAADGNGGGWAGEPSIAQPTGLDYDDLVRRIEHTVAALNRICPGTPLFIQDGGAKWNSPDRMTRTRNVRRALKSVPGVIYGIDGDSADAFLVAPLNNWQSPLSDFWLDTSAAIPGQGVTGIWRVGTSGVGWVGR